MIIKSEPLLKTMLSALTIVHRNLISYDAQDIAQMSANSQGAINKAYLDAELKNVNELMAAAKSDLEQIKKEKEAQS